MADIKISLKILCGRRGIKSYSSIRLRFNDAHRTLMYCVNMSRVSWDWTAAAECIESVELKDTRCVLKIAQKFLINHIFDHFLLLFCSIDEAHAGIKMSPNHLSLIISHTALYNENDPSTKVLLKMFRIWLFITVVCCCWCLLMMLVGCSLGHGLSSICMQQNSKKK